MYELRKAAGGVALALVLSGAAAPTILEAQVVVPDVSDGRWPLQPNAPNNNTLAPFMEGWYANPDGTFSISFGYLNVNVDTLFIPLGENNFLDHAEFDGVQPTVFLPGRHRGVFSLTLPAGMEDESIWWNVTTRWGNTTRVPGRIGAVAYALDWNPRPHGSVTPEVYFESASDVGRGPPGIFAERTRTVSVGEPLTLSVNAMDPSDRDQEDARNVNVPLQVLWSQLQGPASVVYTRHDSNPAPEPANDDVARPRRGPSGPQVVSLPEGRGAARVIVTFPEPGDYLMLAQVNNWAANDSGFQDQCCWTNGYVRVSVR